VRVLLVVLVAAIKVTEPSPMPLEPEVTVSHGTLLSADHEQSAEVATDAVPW